jgi:hypothetical protein
MGWFTRNSDIPDPHIAKSADGLLREAVVQMKDEQVDLGPVFVEMKDGDYRVSIDQAMSKRTDGTSPRQLEVKRESGSVTTKNANLRPGVYEVVLLEKRGALYQPTLVTAWFLVVSSDRHAKIDAQFSEITKLTATWKDQIDEGTRRSFLRASLLGLGSEATPANPAK